MLRVKRTTIAWYLLPTFVTIALINVWPILYTLYFSFTNYGTFHSDDYHFVGLLNYQNLLLDLNSDFFFVLGRTFLYVVVCVALFVIVGMATALALNNKKIKFLPFWRLALIIPWAVPAVITALIWKFLFHLEFGPIDQLLRLAFGPNAGVPWLINPWLAFMAVVIVNLWLSYPFFTVVILGALQSVPQELIEASNVDGANGWQRFRRIILPLLRPAITPAIILSAVITFQMFTMVYLITQGGPYTSADKPGSTELVLIYVYNRLLGNAGANIHYGALAAFSILLFVLLIIMTMIALRATRITKEAQA